MALPCPPVSFLPILFWAFLAKRGLRGQLVGQQLGAWDSVSARALGGVPHTLHGWLLGEMRHMMSTREPAVRHTCGPDSSFKC